MPKCELVLDFIFIKEHSKFQIVSLKTLASIVLTRHISIIKFKGHNSKTIHRKIPKFELVQDFFETNILAKIYNDWAKNVASNALTRIFYDLT